MQCFTVKTSFNLTKQLLLWSFVIVISPRLLFPISKISLEPTEKDLKCFNDYETEMKCSFESDGLRNCSGYKLSITRNEGDL